MTVPEALDGPRASGPSRGPRASRGGHVTRPQALEALPAASAAASGGAAPELVSAPAISPRARRLAQQLGIDWRRVRGTCRRHHEGAAADQAAGGGSAEQ